MSFNSNAIRLFRTHIGVAQSIHTAALNLEVLDDTTNEYLDSIKKVTKYSIDLFVNICNRNYIYNHESLNVALIKSIGMIVATGALKDLESVRTIHSKYPSVDKMYTDLGVPEAIDSYCKAFNEVIRSLGEDTFNEKFDDWHTCAFNLYNSQIIFYSKISKD